MVGACNYANGKRTSGRIMQKVITASPTSRVFSPMLNGIFRHLVIAVASGFARPYNVRFDKPQLSLCALGHGVIVHYGHSFGASDRRTSASEERTAGGASRVFNATKTAASIRDKQDKRTRCRMERSQAQSSAAHESDCARCQRNALTLIIKAFT